MRPEAMEFGRLLGLIDQGDSWWFKETGPEIIPRLWTHNMTAIEVWRLWVVSHSWFACGFEISWDFVPCWHFWPRLPELSRLDHDFQSKRLPSISQRSGICSVPFMVSSLPHVGSLVCRLCSLEPNLGTRGKLAVHLSSSAFSGCNDAVLRSCLPAI